MIVADAPILAMVIKPVDERVAWHLWNWRRWMMSGDFAELGLPGRSSGMGYSHSADFDQLADQADKVAARACDAVIRGLKPLEAKAIRCAYLEEEWVSLLNEAAVLVVAKESVRLGLNRRGIV